MKSKHCDITRPGWRQWRVDCCAVYIACVHIPAKPDVGGVLFAATRFSFRFIK